MKVWVFVEGPSDRIALESLWARWRAALSESGWGIRVVPLEDKPRFFRKIGPRAAEKLMNDGHDLVVGLPDLYPNAEYEGTAYSHGSLADLREVERRLVDKGLVDVYGLSGAKKQAALSRFFPTALKHDAEMLLLAARDELREVLGTADALGRWRNPVEEQNQTKPPKYVVEELFRTRRGRKYRDTVDMRAVLAKVADLGAILYGGGNQLQCPVFKELIDWIGERTGVPAY